jgi:hypothetical protein
MRFVLRAAMEHSRVRYISDVRRPEVMHPTPGWVLVQQIAEQGFDSLENRKGM